LPGETPAGWLGSTLTMRAEENIIWDRTYKQLSNLPPFQEVQHFRLTAFPCNLCPHDKAVITAKWDGIVYKTEYTDMYFVYCYCLQNGSAGVDRIQVISVTTNWLSLRMPSSGMCRRVILVGTNISEERIASSFRVKTISELKPHY
jgi:hypothetical protein